MTSATAEITPELLRDVCGRWVTGVAVITGTSAAGGQLGLAVNSFTSLSLDPPLVLFCPGLRSRSWPGIRDTGRFAVHILSETQSHLMRLFARSGVNKFADVPLRPVADGLPALDGTVARLVCDVDQIHPGGDHEIVVGRVIAVDRAERQPLLYYRGETASLSAPG